MRREGDLVARAECAVGVAGLPLKSLRLGIERCVWRVVEAVAGDDCEEVVGGEEILTTTVPGDETIGEEVAAAGNVDEGACFRGEALGGEFDVLVGGAGGGDV
jgi:hypothetical protein